MARKQQVKPIADLFLEEGGQLRLVEKSVEQRAMEKAKVECLGMTFESEDDLRSYFIQKLREKLADPEFRKAPGFPTGTDDDIIRMSDPPWYTACPNPFLEQFLNVHGKPYDPNERYQRDPFAVDTSVGKTDALYRAHAYHTKVPHLAIVPSILHYTKPGEVVLDGFSGSGMTGVAAGWCGCAPAEYRMTIEAETAKRGEPKPEWGARRAVLNDLGPAASFISANYTLPFSVSAFAKAAKRLLNETEQKFGWMYETLHTDGKTVGRINFTVWSEVFGCPECAGDVVFLEEALDEESKSVKAVFPCPHCKVELTRRRLERGTEALFDTVLQRTINIPKRRPISVNYTADGVVYEKPLDEADKAKLQEITNLGIPPGLPTDRMMHAPDGSAKWGDEWRAGVSAFTHIHHFFLRRAAWSLAFMWKTAASEKDGRLRGALLFFVEQAIAGMSLLNRYAPTHFSQVNRVMSGRIRAFSQHSECSPWYVLGGKLSRLVSAFTPFKKEYGNSIISTGDCGAIQCPSNSIDYIFTDPPFGFNFAYSELNFLVEAWHRVYTQADNEAIVSGHQKKGVYEYQALMQRCFVEYHRVLKPGRWLTVVFSNSSNGIWRAIQEAMGNAGFVISDVRTLDKQQGTFNQVHGISVKQDLIMSAYKPPDSLVERFSLGLSSPENAWAFAAAHLAHVPVALISGGVADVVAERTPQVLYDRMVAFHVQRHMSVPLSTAEFLTGLNERFPERDGMYFLSVQVAEYDRKRNTATELRQLNLFVTDEASAIQWVRRELQEKPRSFQDLQPIFMREIQNWAKHEKTVELKEILRQNCIEYDGEGEVPSQIHGYLSTNFKELRNLKKDDPALIEKATERWYVPDPNKQGDLEKLREKSLLSEFNAYKASKERKLKLFRTEAIRAGFKVAYDAKDYQTIVAVSDKLPETVLQEDEKLLMYYDVASMRLGAD